MVRAEIANRVAKTLGANYEGGGVRVGPSNQCTRSCEQLKSRKEI